MLRKSMGQEKYLKSMEELHRNLKSFVLLSLLLFLLLLY